MFLVIGSQGQVGRALASVLESRKAMFISREDIDLTDVRSIQPKLLKYPRPSALINAAAFTAVDKAEKETETARAINSDAVREIADLCKKQKIPLVHYSTDYVFSGTGTTPFAEHMPTDPINAYGRTKRNGETQIEQSECEHLIFRTSWVYDEEGENFLNTMIKYGSKRDLLRVVNDQHGAPTYARHLAQATVDAIDKALEMDRFPSGTYHMCNAGETTWYDFALAIFELARAQDVPLTVEDVVPVSTKEYPTPAIRPRNSRLDCSKLEKVFGITLKDWHEGLKECMGNKYGN